MRFAEQFGGHLQIVQRMTNRQIGLSAKQAKNSEIGTTLNEKQSLKLGHAPRLQRWLPSNDQPGGKRVGSRRIVSNWSLETSATNKRYLAPSTLRPKSTASAWSAEPTT